MGSKWDHYKSVLKRRRLERGYSQTELQEKSGILWRVIGVLERGEREPTNLELTKLAHGLGTNVSELLAEIYFSHLENLRALEQELQSTDGNVSQPPLISRSVDDLRKQLDVLVPSVIDTIITTVLVLRSAPAAQTLFSTYLKDSSDRVIEKSPKARVRASRRRGPSQTR
jgi:transcriptional regulator with XRE-family HTH domain